MMKKDMDKFKPYWPKTLIFWGAGATASLGLSSTYEIGNIIYILSGINSNESLNIRINNAFKDVEDKTKDEIESLLLILDEENYDMEIRKGLGFSKERICELKKTYNWFILKEIMKRCPGIKNGDLNLVDLYNLIDLHIQTGQGFNTEKTYVRPEQLIVARNTLNMIISIIHSVEYIRALNYKKKEINHYFEFASCQCIFAK